MTGNADLISFVPSTDLERSLFFYRDELKLDFVERSDFAVVLTSGGRMVRVVAVETFTPQPFTILGWQVPNIRAAVARYTKGGLCFIDYPHLDQDAMRIWTAPDDVKVAWFNDPDGNVLSFTEWHGN